MSLPLAFGALIAGLLLLVWGGDLLVKGAVTLAKKWGVGTLFIGIVIIGFGTSLPEMLATMSASLNGAPGLALGNIVGSNSANIGLILAVALLFMGHKHCPQDKPDWLLMFTASVVFCAILLLLGGINALTGLGLLVLLAAYLFISFRIAHTKDTPTEDGDVYSKLWLAAVALLGGFVALVIGAELLVKGALVVASWAGVPEVVIGVSVVAIGTSLPELAATIAAARQKQMGLVVGNVLGSNVFNLLGAAGFSSLITPLPDHVVRPDLLPMLLFAVVPALLCWQLPLKGRALGAITLVGYVTYIGWRFV